MVYCRFTGYVSCEIVEYEHDRRHHHRGGDAGEGSIAQSS